MNGKQRKTLAKIFTDPPSANIKWSEIESLFKALGAKVSEGRGSGIKVFLNNQAASFHRPHPRPNAGKGVVKAVRTFLANAGIEDPGDA